MPFVNPYTFIPLEKGTPEYSRPSVPDKPIRGVLHCVFETVTPLSVPEVDVSKLDKDKDERQSYLPFYRLGNRLAVPGSSLRGAFRSVYEILTDSCLRTNGRLLHSASSLKKPGLLSWSEEKGEYLLYKAERLRVTNERLVRNGGTWLYAIGEELHFVGAVDESANTRLVQRLGKRTEDGGEVGYFLYVHRLPTRRPNHPSIFKMVDGDEYYELDRATMDAFVKNVELFVVNNGKSNESVAYQEALRGLRDDRGAKLPVWYASEKVSDEKTAFQLAPSQLSRSVYTKTPLSMAKDCERAQCSSATKLCPACKLFGFVPPSGADGGVAGRVRFGDAIVVEDDVKTSTPWLPNLMEPRQSSFEFYLRNTTIRHKHAFTPETPGTELAGRKMYWHHQREGDWDFGKGTEFNVQAELVPAGVHFAFDVYVDDVSLDELNTLVYALTYGRAWDSADESRRYCHRIGHGKPVGLGSIRVSVEHVVVREFSADGYVIKANGSWKQSRSVVEGRLSSLSAAKAVANFGAIPERMTISYPAVKAGGDIFEWFGKNRGRWSNRGPVTYKELLDESANHTLRGEGAAKQANREDGQPQQAQQSARETSVIYDYNEGKGYGFIRYPGKNLFFHISSCQGFVPQRGQKVSFVVGPGQKLGQKAAKEVRLEH